jgi:hypothetical protein
VLFPLLVLSPRTPEADRFGVLAPDALHGPAQVLADGELFHPTVALALDLSPGQIEARAAKRAGELVDRYIMLGLGHSARPSLIIGFRLAALACAELGRRQAGPSSKPA